MEFAGVAIYYGIVAWLACWEVDLTVAIARGPLFIDPIIKWIIVLICLVIILRGDMRLTWGWNS